ncbi:Cytosolic Carboxypeptidase 1 [Manis pentadactyla]|nr:Cytosolic Carboxypeptidase 1 [Manis pentadactyla]
MTPPMTFASGFPEASNESEKCISVSSLQWNLSRRSVDVRRCRAPNKLYKECWLSSRKGRYGTVQEGPA